MMPSSHRIRRESVRLTIHTYVRLLPFVMFGGALIAFGAQQTLSAIVPDSADSLESTVLFLFAGSVFAAVFGLLIAIAVGATAAHHVRMLNLALRKELR